MALKEKERRILFSINVASENDPHKPEFPPDNPKFPATPTYKIKVPGFTNVWLKDESYNPTGTHKDRLAWEMVVTYRDMLLAKKDSLISEKLPQLSIITSGSAAIAIQSMLNKYKLPSLKCLVDLTLDRNIVDLLEDLGCELFFVDLSRKPLNWKEILDVYQTPETKEFWSSSYTPLDRITEVLSERARITKASRYTKKFGIPSKDFYIGSADRPIRVRVKDSRAGTRYSETYCNGCSEAPCQEGLYNILHATDGSILPCRFSPTQLPGESLEDFRSSIRQVLDIYRGLELSDNFWRT